MSQRPPLERAFFREGDDGATVFFPWGLAHRGYRLEDPNGSKRASRAASLLMGSVIAIGAWTAAALQPALESETAGLAEILRILATPGAALLLAIALYAAWVSRFVEKLPESDLVVSRQQRLREAAELVEPWKLALIGVAVIGLSALLVWLQARAWWLGSLGVALGLGLLWWSSLLRRAAASEPSPTWEAQSR